jgi:hypothetical protein
MGGGGRRVLTGGIEGARDAGENGIGDAEDTLTLAACPAERNQSRAE